MYCSKCGYEASEQAVVCEKCGGVIVATESVKPPKNWLVLSILSAVFCCWPFSIVGIINAAKVDRLFKAGDMAGANAAAKKAKTWTIVSFCVGIVVWPIYIILVMVGTMAEMGLLEL